MKMKHKLELEQNKSIFRTNLAGKKINRILKIQEKSSLIFDFF